MLTQVYLYAHTYTYVIKLKRKCWENRVLELFWVRWLCIVLYKSLLIKGRYGEGILKRKGGVTNYRYAIVITCYEILISEYRRVS